MWPVSYKIIKAPKSGRSQAREMKEFMLLIIAYYTSSILDLSILYMLFHQHEWKKTDRNQMIKQFHPFTKVWP